MELYKPYNFQGIILAQLPMTFKKIILTLAIICAIENIANAQQGNSEEFNLNPNAQFDSSKKSIPAAAIGKIGQANVTIRYHSPGLRKRVVWGGLVPYDEVWVTGAHSATTLEIDKPFMVGNKTIAAGKYAIFTIPAKEEWTVIINTNYEQHLTDDYNAKDDVVRIQVKPIMVDKPLERLQYFIKEQAGNKGTITVGWDKIMVPFEIKTM